MKTILSIQSKVSVGHVGNSAVEFPLQRLGDRVIAINTVQFSNSTIYGKWKGQVFEPGNIREVFLGIKEMGVLPYCDALLTGFMGSAQLGGVVLDILAELQQANPYAFYCCDPVMGDHDRDRGFFVKPELCEFFRDHLVPKANLITPNKFELEYLTNSKITTLTSAIEAARKLLTPTLNMVLLTSLLLPEESQESICMLVVNATEVVLTKTPLLVLPEGVNGAGDLTAALFTHFYLLTRNMQAALEQTTARVFSILEKTAHKKAREMQLVDAQAEFIHPTFSFHAEHIVE